MAKPKPKRKCACRYDGPVQVVSCAEHNVAAKNLNKAQAMIAKLELVHKQERDELLAKISHLEEVEHYTSHVIWQYATEVNVDLAVKEPLADAPPISFGKMKEIVNKRIAELLEKAPT